MDLIATSPTPRAGLRGVPHWPKTQPDFRVQGGGSLHLTYGQRRNPQILSNANFTPGVLNRRVSARGDISDAGLVQFDFISRALESLPPD